MIFFLFIPRIFFRVVFFILYFFIGLLTKISTMRRVYVPPPLTPRPSPDAKNSPVVTLLNSFTPIKPSSFRPESFRQYIAQHNVPKLIRGRELFIRSIRRILENIREKKQRAKHDQQIFSTFEEAINVFQDLNFMKCVLLKKKLLDPNHQTWTVEFARQGGLHTLLSYLQHISKTNLSLVDAILVNEVLQCLRAMMNIDELFEHIASNPQYIDSIAKVLSVSSAEVRMRVFELLTALCVYSQDGYELVLQALQDFQNQHKLSNIFAVILEQLKYSVVAKHKWSAIALLNTILRSTESIEKRMSYRHVLYSNGLLSIFEQARVDADQDVTVQIDIFLENQRQDEEQFLGHFDPNDNQAVYQAIQLQFAQNSNESAVLLTAMQTLYSTLTSVDVDGRSKILQSLLDFISHAGERKSMEKSVQTDPIPQPDTNITTAPHHILGPLAPTPSEKPTEHPPNSGLINTVISVNVQPPPIQPDPIKATLPPPPPFGGLPPSPPAFGGPPPPPPFGGPPPPPPPGGLPPPPPGGLPPPPPSGAPLPSTSTAGLSALVDSIPKPKGQVRRLQWKKLPQAILSTSQFWSDVNKNIDSQINFSEFEEYFKVNVTATAEKKDTEAPKKKKEAILTSSRSLAINLFQKKFNFTDLQYLIRTIENPDPSLGIECFRLLHQALPTKEEIDLVHNFSTEDWTAPEQFVHVISLVPYYELRIRTMLLMCEFDETFNDFKRKFEHIIRVINFLQCDSSIKQLARSLLSIGDFLNYGSYGGNAFGFRLDILNQLQSIRLSDNGNLLAILLNKTPQNFKFVDDLKPLLADDIQLQGVKTEYQQWRKKIVDGLKEINTIEIEQIIVQYQPFYQKSNARITNELDPLMMACESKEKDFMKQFGETDTSEFNYETCCAIFRQLIDQVAKENQERKKPLAPTKSLFNSMKSRDESTAVSIGKLDSLMSDIKKNKFATTPARRIRRRPDIFENMDREIK